MNPQQDYYPCNMAPAYTYDTLDFQGSTKPGNLLPKEEADTLTTNASENNAGEEHDFSPATPNQRIHNVGRLALIMVSYARKVEARIYETADNHLEYYYLFYEEQRTPIELEMKRQKRKEEQQKIEDLAAVLLFPDSPSETVSIADDHWIRWNPPAPTVRLGLVDNDCGFVLPMCQVTAIPMLTSKEWQWHLTPCLRNHLVRNLANELVIYARKLEGDVYAMSRSCEDYCNMLATEIYKTQKTLENRIDAVQGI